MDKSADTGHDQRYDDIISLPHHVSLNHPPMSMRNRAAQFAPFAALTGYDVTIQETARVTEDRREVADDVQDILNEKLRMLEDITGSRPEITIIYFRPDETKAGGTYMRISGRIRRIDEYEKTIVLCDGTNIPINDVTAIEGTVFQSIENDCR